MIGKRLREARIRCNLTQDELAQQAGLTSHVVWKIENGKREPTASELGPLCVVLGVSADWVLGLAWNDGMQLAELAELRAWKRDVEAWLLQTPGGERL